MYALTYTYQIILFVSHLTQGPAKRPHFQLRSNSVRGDPSSEQSKIVLKSALKKSNTSAEILTDAASRRERSKFLSCQCLGLKFNGILGKNYFSKGDNNFHHFLELQQSSLFQVILCYPDADRLVTYVIVYLLN